MPDDIFPRGNPAIPTARGGYNEIRTDSGALDEVCLEHATVHLEQMGSRQWWLGLTRDGKTLHVWFDIVKIRGKRRLVAHIGDDELGLPVVETESL